MCLRWEVSVTCIASIFLKQWTKERMVEELQRTSTLDELIQYHSSKKPQTNFHIA